MYQREGRGHSLVHMHLLLETRSTPVFCGQTSGGDVSQNCLEDDPTSSGLRNTKAVSLQILFVNTFCKAQPGAGV